MDIMEVVQTYGASVVIIILIAVILAMSKGLGVWDNLWGRVRKHFDSEYAEKEKQKSIEKKTDDAEARLREEQEQIAELRKADKEVREEMQRTDRQILDELAAIRKTLDERTHVEDARHADMMREYILRFNMELVRGMQHTREDFVEVLAKMDEYERYCHSHTDYENNRAKAAIANIDRVYADRLAKNDFA